MLFQQITTLTLLTSVSFKYLLDSTDNRSKGTSTFLFDLRHEETGRELASYCTLSHIKRCAISRSHERQQHRHLITESY